MQYFRAYRSAFESPNWMVQLLIGILSQIVPIIGPIVFMGYLYETIEARHRFGPDRFPDFDFNRLGPYLSRGVWPFLVSLIVSLPVIFLMMMGMFGTVIALRPLTPDNPPPPALFIVLSVVIASFFILILAIHFLSMPMTLRAGLSQDFGSAFSLTFLRDFLGRVWKELLLSIFFLIVTAPFVMLAGLLCLCIGIYPAGVVLMFAQYHLQYQIYELYLERGGTPIPLKQTWET